MTYPPTPGPDGAYPPPPDPPIPAYQPPQPYDQQQFGYAAPGYGTPPQQGYGPPVGYDYGYPGSPYSYQSGFPAARATDGLAIASLVVSCVGVLGLCFWSIGGLLGILGAIFGHVSRRRIRASGEAGSGLALAGIIVGWTVTGIAVLGAAALIAIIATDDSNY